MDDLKVHYTQAAIVPGLAVERAERLVAHVVSRNRLPGHEATPPAIVRLAAALLAGQDSGLSSPTALAEAEAVGRMPGLGLALLEVQNGLLALATFAPDSLGRDGLQREAVRRVLGHLITEAQGLLRQLETGS